MALHVNSSSASSIPNNVIGAMTILNSQFPDKWQQGWLASLIDAQHNDEWELKLTSKDGISQRRILIAERQSSGAVCASLLELRNTWPA
jgi:hypothetical protein